MKILITGAKGQLGSEIAEIIRNGKAEIGEVSENIKLSEIILLDVDELNIINLKAVKDRINYLKPDVVINCAAATNVDGCESNEDAAFKINSIGPRNLALGCEEVKAKLVQVSTDYVFDCIRNKPLTEYDLPSPSSIYGKSKLLGEQYVKQFCSRYFIVRTAWLYGYSGHNFVYTMLRLGKEKDSISVVNDQIGNPTYANDLAYHILKLMETEEYGLYHCTNNGECTWYDFARSIIVLSGEECEVKPCISEQYRTLAKRPKYSALDNMMLRNTIGDEMRNWEEAVISFMRKVRHMD